MNLVLLNWVSTVCYIYTSVAPYQSKERESCFWFLFLSSLDAINPYHTLYQQVLYISDALNLVLCSRTFIAYMNLICVYHCTIVSMWHLWDAVVIFRGHPIPKALIHKVDEYIPDDFVKLLDIYQVSFRLHGHFIFFFW